MKVSQGILTVCLFFLVFISGCDNERTTVSQTPALTFELDPQKTTWLTNHLPAETIAYLNIPTPWNYLFDAKADVMHGVQSLASHQQQVDLIKQGVKDNYFKLIPAAYQDLITMLLEHMQTSLEVAVINNSPAAFLPTVAVASRLQNINGVALANKMNAMLKMIDPRIKLEPQSQPGQWQFQINQFPVFMQYDEADGKLLIYGGMGAKADQFTTLWNEQNSSELTTIKALSRQSDPSGLNLKMWLATAKIYQFGQAFLPPEQQQMMLQFGLNQMEYLWLGFESAQGHSALAMHMLMPDVGWRQLLPKATDWFDVELASIPRSVVQLTLPTAEQVQQAINYLEIEQKLNDKDRKDLALLHEIEASLGFELLDFFRANYQQAYWVKDDAGSWIAMKVKDQTLHEQMSSSLYEYFDIHPELKTLAGQQVWQAHFSVYQAILDKNDDLSQQTEEVREMMGIFKEHSYWYQKDDVFYMSSVPQVLAEKQNASQPIMLSEWLDNQQRSDWRSAIFAYGKDIKHMPQDLYHMYLLVLQGMGDLAQTEVDLFALPTASELNLPDSGRVNLVLSSDADKVSLILGYDYTWIEGLLSAEGGMTSVAVLAVLTAYAVPAYRDYTVRAKIGEQLAMAAGVKMAVAEQFYTQNSFAGVVDMIDLSNTQISVDEVTGVITIDLDGVDSVFQAGDELYLEPLVTESHIEWTCYGNISERYLPPSCR